MTHLPSEKLYKLDPTAVAELVALYRAPLVYFAFGYLKDIVASEDAVSDAIVKLLVKKPTFHDENALKAYLYKATKNTALDYLRKQKQQKKYVDDKIEEFKAFPSYWEQTLFASEEQKELARALEKLQDNYREILYLRYYENLPIADISKILGKNKKHVYNLLSRAKAILSTILEKEVTDNEIER